MWNLFVVLPLAASPFYACENPYFPYENYQASPQISQAADSIYQTGNIYDDGKARVVDETKTYSESLKSAASLSANGLNQDQIKAQKDKITADILSLGGEAEDFMEDLLKKMQLNGDSIQNNDSNGISGRSGSNGDISGSNGGYGTNGSGFSGSSNGGGSSGEGNGGAGGSNDCDDDAKSIEGGLFGTIPDTWYCNVFGPVPTLDELFGEN